MIGLEMVLALCLGGGGESVRVRPWAGLITAEQQLADQRKDAGEDPDKLVALASWCAGKGLCHEMEEILQQVLKRDPAHAKARALLGHAKAQDGSWQPEELARFSRLPVKIVTLITPPSAKDRERLLAQKDRELRLASSTYFDLWTDLESEPLKRYTEQLNGYYRTFKNRFQAYAGGNIDVLLFANRSDFLRFYLKTRHERGEHVGGFYVHSWRALVFYDDPSDSAMILDTARHECTHLLIDLGFGGAPLPLWLNEGMACFLASAEIEMSDPYVAGLAADVLEQLRTNSAPAISKLIELERAAFGFPQYAASWSLVHFLSQPEQGSGFQRFLDRLRHELPKEPESEAKQAAYEKGCVARTNALFRQSVGDLSALESAWRHYFDQQFAFSSPRQLADFGLSVSDRARSAAKPQDRDRWLAQAEVAFAAVPAATGSNAAFALEAKQGAFSCMLQRAGSQQQTPGSERLFLRSVLQQIASLPDDDAGAWLRGDLAGAALLEFRRMAFRGAPTDALFDCRKAILDDMGGRDDPTRSATVVLFDELLDVAFRALARTLAKNPLHQGAARQWILLAVRLAPSRAEDVFPILRLQVEKDPDDLGLAALALAYLALGDHAWGKELIQEAKYRSVSPEGLKQFADYFP